MPRDGYQERAALVADALLNSGALELSNREIARLLGIRRTCVGIWRRRMEWRGAIPRVTYRLGRSGYMDVSATEGTDWRGSLQKRQMEPSRSTGARALDVIALGKWAGCALADVDDDDLTFIRSLAYSTGLRGAISSILRRRNLLWHKRVSAKLLARLRNRRDGD